MLGLLKSSAIDITALRVSPQFRRLFAAQIVSQIGSQITAVAILMQVWDLTHSLLLVGLVGLVQLCTTIPCALLGGAIADSMDRRRLLLLVQVGMFCASGGLALLALGEPPLWALYALAGISSALSAVDGPARTAVIPSLVDAATLRSAVQLREVLTQSGRVFGPVLAGLIVATFGFTEAYVVDALTFALAFALFLGLPPLIPERRRRFELSSISEGLAYVVRSPVLASTFIADIIAMVLGMPRAVFPAMAELVFDVGKLQQGFMFAAPAAGALIGLLVIGGLTSRVRREGLAVLVSVSVWGLAIAAFGLSPWFWLALVLLALAGAADMVSAIFRQTILLATVPDELRGRMSSVHILVVTGGPPLGDFEAGAAAELVGLRPSVVLGGLGCVAGIVALGAAVPKFTRWVDPSRANVTP